MTLLIQSPRPLEDHEITQHLQAARKHCCVELSHYAVTAMIEVPASRGYAYVMGVNVENTQHHRLSTHGEQNAVTAALTLFGGDIRFSRAWIMTAPDHLEPGSTDPLANHSGPPCGHCRQLLISLARPDAEIFSVTLNGEISDPRRLSELLPDAFTEQDMMSEKNTGNTSKIKMKFFDNIRFQPAPCLFSNEQSENSLFRYLSSLTPHLIDRKLETSPIAACLLKIHGSNYYAPGVLIQDVAFLTSDAVFVALGHAITQIGAKELEIESIHLYSETLNVSALSGSELDALAPFVKNDIPVRFYTPQGETAVYHYSDCAHAHASRLLDFLAVRHDLCFNR